VIRLETRNRWGDVEGQDNAGGPGSDGASPYPEPRPTRALALPRASRQQISCSQILLVLLFRFIW
jgi:hypothetical protein